MTFVIAIFRQQFPEFADIARYPDPMIQLWSDFATSQVRPERWKSQTLMGISLYTAHELVMASQNAKTGRIDGTPGTFSGPVNTKTVGPITAGYDATQTAEKDAGYWNLTTYGKQFYRLTRIFGAGAIQL